MHEVQPIVLGEGEKSPEGREFAAFPETGYKDIERKHDQVGGEDPQGTFNVELAIGNGLMTGNSCEQLTADEIAAEDEEEIDTGPAEFAYGIEGGRAAADKAGMIDEHEDDGQGPQMIQAREAVG